LSSDEIEPDTKDWTWVITEPCPECGLDAAKVRYDDIPALIRANAASWEELLLRPGVAQRPVPTVWSPLEYACHVRDVFRIFDGRLVRMLTEDDPLFENWDQDATAVEDRYADQVPTIVAADLVAAAGTLAERFAAVPPADRARPGRRSDGASFTIDTIARYLLHDPVHHLWDVARV
jgi:hypothetical protein